MILLNIYECLKLFNNENLKYLINPAFKLDISFLNQDFIHFINLVNKLRFEKRLNFLIKVFKELKEQFENKNCVVFYNNDSLNFDLLKEIIQNKYLKEKVNFTFKKNNSIKKGIKFFFNFQVYDATYENFINKIKEQVLK